MPTIERVVEYAVAPERLWAVVADLRGWQDWLTVLREWATEPAETLVQGARLDGVITVMSIPMTVTWTVDVCDPPRSLVLSGPAVLNSTVTLRADVEPTATGSRAALTIDVDNPLLVGPIAETLMGSIRADVDASMTNLESRLA